MAGDKSTAQARALALAREGRWDEAHALVQAHHDRLSCLIHAYLHRVEGDPDNAAYWYRRGGEEPREGPPDEELARLAEMLSEG